MVTTLYTSNIKSYKHRTYNDINIHCSHKNFSCNI